MVDILSLQNLALNLAFPSNFGVFRKLDDLGHWMTYATTYVMIAPWPAMRSEAARRRTARRELYINPPS